LNDLNKTTMQSVEKEKELR